MIFIPAIKKGESRNDYVARCVAWVKANEGLDNKAAVGKCEGMYNEHLKTGKNYEDVDFFVPPDAGNLPDSGKKILSKVYSECRSRWVAEHPNDKENEGNKTMCSQVAWTAVHNAGYKKNEKGEWGMDKSEMQTFTFECELTEFSLETQLTPKTDGAISVEDEKWIKFRATAVIGDRMMKNVFIPYKHLKESLDQWNGTFHDINHMGTSYPDTAYPFKRQNIEYVIGYQDNVQANDQTKAITMDVTINKNHPKYQYWKSFIDINKAAGRVPNVSMSINAIPKQIRAKEINCDISSYGLKDDDIITCLYNIMPKALTTCIEGDCNSEKGCGITINHEKNNCEDCINCKCKQKLISGADELSSEEAKEFAEIQKKIKFLKEEK